MKEIEQLNQELHRIIINNLGLPQLFEQISDRMTEFASSTRWFQDYLASKLFDSAFYSTQLNSIWQNELTLFRSPEHSILMYFWEPNAIDIIHDHGSWGVITPFGQPFSERKYKRLDDGTKESYAELEETSYRTVKPGEASYVLPLKEGIHRIENLTPNYIISVNVYGRPYRHGYVQFFDQDKRKVWKAFPPRTYKQIMTIKAMADISEPWVEQLLAKALEKDLPDYIKEQCRLSLNQLGNHQG